MSAHVFAEIPHLNIPRSSFLRSHNLKTTLTTDYLYPIYVDECLPGDTFKMKATFFGRLTTPVCPIMDNIYLDTFFFAIPVRLVDDGFKRLMGDRPFGDIRNDYTTPVLNTGDSLNLFNDVGSLSDYLGIPPKVLNLDFVPWWHRSYALVYNEWFKDENLCPALPVAGVHEDGTITTESISDYPLVRRGKRKDYFTGCLPWPQKGDSPNIILPSLSMPVRDFDSFYPQATVAQRREFLFNPTFYNPDGSPLVTDGSSQNRMLTLNIPNSEEGDTATMQWHNGTNYASYRPAYMSLAAGLSQTTLFSVNQLREAFAIQHLLERDALGGTRYTELIRSHFGVVSPDARLQRPEYLGGSSQLLNVTTVPQTAGNDGGVIDPDDQGSTYNLGYTGAFVTVSDRCFWQKTFTEHTLILGLANIRADLSYQQGLPRMFSRRTKYDFYWPELANLSEQPVFNREIYAQGSSVVDNDGNPVDDGVFGYQERWAEYRYHPSMITGHFRSVATNSLDWWHLSQNFTALPKLNASFIQEQVPIDRVIYISQHEEPSFLLDCHYNLTCVRPMPVYSVPGLSRL